MSGYTARYRAYCAAHGHPNDPDGMLATDTQRWPGGHMTGFILWVGEQWRAWGATRPSGKIPEVLTDEHHAEFDAWLSETVTPVT